MSERILQVSGLYAKVGGAEVYMHRLIDALRERGLCVGVFGGSPEVEIDEEETCVIRRPDFDAAALIQDEAVSEAFVAFCDRFRPDLIHAHNISSFPADFARTVRSIGVPVVQTVHEWGLLCPNAWCVLPDGSVCEGGPGMKCLQNGCESNYPFDGRILTSAILRYNLTPRSFDRFICPSQALARDLGRHGYPGLVELPYWAEQGEGATTSANADRDPDLILFLGRLVREKGVEYLVRAMPMVLEKRPSARLAIVGGGSDQERLEGIARDLRLGDRVVFHGRVPHEQVQSYFRRAWVNVLPSIWCENSPVTCYESYLSGLPMIASDIAGLPAMVVEGETGLLARPRDSEHLAERLVEILGDRELHGRLAAGCIEALGRYRKDDHIDQILALYGEMLENASRKVVAQDASGPGHSLLDEDVVGILDRTLREYTRIESWAVGMKKHIDWMESKEPPSGFARLVRKLKG